MGGMDFQIGFGDESTYGTAVTPTRFFEYDSESIEESEGRTEGDPLRGGSAFLRHDRFTPYFSGASGSVSMAVLTKGFGYFLKHMLGQSSSSAAVDGKYTHTGTEGDLFGKSFTMQMNRPFNPSGTSQAFTYRGGSVTEWTLQNSVDGNLMLELGLDFQQVSTATALATPVYPAAMDNFTWAGGVLQVGGTSVDVTEISLQGNNGYNVDRRQIRGNTDKKQPTSNRREGSFSLKADFESMALRNRVRVDARDDALATIVATWTGPRLIGTTSRPTLVATIPAGRFDEWKGATEGTEAIEQELSGAVRWNGSQSPISIAYGSADTAA